MKLLDHIHRLGQSLYVLLSGNVGGWNLTKQDSHSLRPKGYPGEQPMWTVVPTAKLGISPYNRVCQVVGTQGGNTVGIGTGWLWGAGKLLTAAHVVARADQVRIRMANQANWHSAVVAKIADGYFAPDGTERKTSQADVALLTPPVGWAAPVDALPSSSALAWVIGFQDGELVEHAGPAADFGSFISHDAHTAGEHSGCPVIQNGQYRGVHVGLFSESRRYMNPKPPAGSGRMNSAVRITGAVAAEFD
jgi:hypothetical protein